METGQPDPKRLRLDPRVEPRWTGPSSHPGPVLPPPPQQHPTHHPAHHTALPPFQTHGLYSRPAEPPSHPAHHHHDDRRHHEQDPYPPPIQEHHRQQQHPPSPAAHVPPPFPHYHRDSAVKRESGDEPPLPQMRRPNSTGNAPDGLPPPLPPHGLPYPGQHPDEHRRPTSFDNGPPMPQSPQIYRQPQPSNFHQPPTPVATHSQYEASPHAYTPTAPAQDMYSSLPISSAKRKAQRASQACDSCRQLKAKCDEQRPCKNCSDKGMKCVYRDLPTKQPDKVSADILELMSSLKNQITAEFNKMDQRMSRMEQVIKLPGQPSDVKVESVEGGSQDYEEQRSLSAGSKDMPQDTPREMPEERASSPKEIDGLPENVEAAHATLREYDEWSVYENPTGPPVVPGQPSMPADHTTLAALLLQWPSINSMVQGLVQIEKIQPVAEFPIRQEQQRGLLRVFGRGEGLDQDIRQLPNRHEPQTDQAMNDINDESSDAPSPMATGEAWGQVGGLGMPAPNVDAVYKNGVIHVDGLPDFDRQRVQSYVQSFKDNILNMHPILIPKELDAMVTVFLQSIPLQTAKPHMKANPKFAVSSNTPTISISETSGKRKRSPASDEQNLPSAYHRPGLPYRSIHHALVLVVLALGKICLHKEKIPDVVPDQDQQPMHNSPSVRNGVPAASPSQGSPPGPMLQSQTSGLPSPKENERALPSRRSSFQGSGAPLKSVVNLKRNLDTIPGLDYFGLALDIFGSHIGGHSLRHVHVALFLGLYHGQLGRVLESWSYIALAGRTLQVVLRPSLSRLVELGSFPSSRRDNQLVLAYWTCLQLESDILAELPMPQSGILSYEDTIPYPNVSIQPCDAYSENVTGNYIAQLYLRKRLNSIHNSLYSRNPQEKEKTMEEKVLHLQDSLKKEKSTWIPAGYSFSDTDPPAIDILGARLRAKYWGTQVLLYRPFIAMILKNKLEANTFRDNTPPHPSQWARLGIDVADVEVPDDIDPRALSYARLGLAALVESTQAFHGLDRRYRIIVTNVFTTAHAQWGNLLVLAACYKHRILRKFIRPDLLYSLFTRTIEFFRLIAHESSPLTADLNILIGLAQTLDFYDNNSDRRPSSSFSSTVSGGPPLAMQHSGDYPGNPGTPTMPPPSHGMP